LQIPYSFSSFVAALIAILYRISASTLKIQSR
jgi:hypothetical protein